MKKTFLSFFLALLSVSLFAAQRSVNEAAAIAAKVNNPTLHKISKQSASMAPQRPSTSVRLVRTQNQPMSDKVAFYVFDREDQGFVIVSADDNTRDILAYSNQGSFPEQVPANVQFLLDYMAERIASSGKKDKTATLTASYTPVIPLLDGIQWNQDEPYWNKCPIDKNGDRAYTGCVATATAQVMRYWKWPTKGTGSHSYTAKNVSGTLSANFGTTTYDWANMPKTTSGYTTTAQKNAVATLMYHVGVAIDMNYGGETIGGSGAYTNDVATALVNYFGYKNTLEYVDTYDWNYGRQVESASTTAQRMREDLAKGHPIIVGGSSEGASSGHEFVFEGYDENGLFYVNWGWGGSYNGYYAIDDLEPGGSGIGGNGAGYSHYLDYIIGIEPNGSVTPPTPSNPNVISGLQYGDAYYTTNDGSPMWYVDSYNGYNNGYIYPELYFIVNAKSKTSLSGTYNLLYVEYTASKGNVVEGYNGRITISFAQNGGYNIEGAFYGEDGNAYAFNQTIAISAYDMDNDYAEITLVEPPTPIVKRDTIDVISNKMTYKDFIASNAAVQYYAGDDAGYAQFCVTSKNASSVFGTFDVWTDYSWINFDETTSTEIQEGKITVTEEQTGVRLTGYVIGNDEKYYRLNWFMVAGILSYDTDAPFNYDFIWSSMSTGVKDGVATIYADDGVKAMELELYCNPALTSIPAGTYIISNTKESGTALKSVGVEGGYLQPCWAGIIAASGGISDCWFLVEGTVTLSYDVYGKLAVEVVGKNSCGQDITVAITYVHSASSVITYTATEKLPETINYNSNGLHTNAFNVSITSHDFSNGIGTITFADEVTEIGERAFYNCSGLTTIDIPNSVITIGDYAFYECSGLTSVTIPNSVTTIGEWAFYECSALTSITIPNSVSSIGENTFSGCSALTSVTIGNSVTTIGDGAFDRCSSLTSITIPNSVTTIGDGAFDRCSSLTSITIPNSVTTIGYLAFAWCTGLTSINVDAANTHYCSIDGVLFNYAKDTLIQYPIGNTRTKYTIPNSVTTIREYAFYQCSALTSVTVGNSVKTIGESAFFGCSGLTSIDVDAANTHYSSVDGVLFNYAKDTLIQYPIGNTRTKYIIPNSVKTIGEWAFEDCSALTSVTIGNSVTTIGMFAFAHCSALTSVTIGKSVTTIGENAFYECSGLTSVTIPNSVTTIGRVAFYDCTGLKDVSVAWTSSNQLPTMGDYVFSNIANYAGPSAATLHVPSGTKSIYENADQWKDFGTIKDGINDDDPVVGQRFEVDKIWYEITSLGQTNTVKVYWYDNYSSPTSLVIPASVSYKDYTFAVTEIYGWTFANNANITSIVLPNTLETIGEGAFYGCANLTNVTAPALFFDVPDYYWSSYPQQFASVVVNGGELNENALLYLNCSNKSLKTLDISAVTNTEFADEAFEGYYNLETLLLPSSLKSISYMMVAGCVNIKSIDIPVSVIEIGQRAFEDCRSITTINFKGKLLKKISSWAFYDAHQLKSLTLPEGVEEIGEGAFYGCVYLEDLVLPRTIQTIGDNGFSLCSKLSKITVHSATPPIIEAKTFYEVNRQIPVYVPKEAVADYKQADYWKEFNIVAIEDVTNLESVHGSQSTVHKYFHNGNLIIERNDTKYTPAGQKVR